MIQAVIFDMDGLLINSEPFWKAVEIEVFKKVGIELTVEKCLKTVGLRIDEVVTYWHDRKPWDHVSKKAIETEIVHKMIERITNEGEALPGVYDVVEFFWNQRMPMAIASSLTSTTTSSSATVPRQTSKRRTKSATSPKPFRPSGVS